jgi:hypothetical protein
MRTSLALSLCTLAALALSACATQPPSPACPAGQQKLRTAQLFFGQEPAPPALTEVAFRRFVDEELTPRFPDGLTVLEGGAQWRGPENQRIRESAKVVLIVLPKRGDAGRRIQAVRSAYKARFRQDSALALTAPACVAF